MAFHPNMKGTLSITQRLMTVLNTEVPAENRTEGGLHNRSEVHFQCSAGPGRRCKGRLYNNVQGQGYKALTWHSRVYVWEHRERDRLWEQVTVCTLTHTSSYSCTYDCVTTTPVSLSQCVLSSPGRVAVPSQSCCIQLLSITLAWKHSFSSAAVRSVPGELGSWMSVRRRQQTEQQWNGWITSRHCGTDHLLKYHRRCYVNRSRVYIPQTIY